MCEKIKDEWIRFLKNNFRQDLQDFMDIYFHFFPNKRNNSQSASRKRYYNFQLSIIPGIGNFGWFISIYSPSGDGVFTVSSGKREKILSIL